MNQAESGGQLNDAAAGHGSHRASLALLIGLPVATLLTTGLLGTVLDFGQMETFAFLGLFLFAVPTALVRSRRSTGEAARALAFTIAVAVAIDATLIWLSVVSTDSTPVDPLSALVYGYAFLIFGGPFKFAIAECFWWFGSRIVRSGKIDALGVDR